MRHFVSTAKPSDAMRERQALDMIVYLLCMSALLSGTATYMAFPLGFAHMAIAGFLFCLALVAVVVLIWSRSND